MTKSRISMLAAVIVSYLMMAAWQPAAAAGTDASDAEAKAVLAAKISAADAIETAEDAMGGRTVDFGVDEVNGVISYLVEVATADGRYHDVYVDMQTGAVLKIADADDSDKK